MRLGRNEPTDLKTLSGMLKALGIEHIYRKHPVATLEPQVLDAIGYFPTGTHQILIESYNEPISIIRGSVSFGDFELYGEGFDAERFETEEEVIKALTK